jgi:DNA replicative helicase MCM subunit Mcm2 (Cdc46/Mcm family)
MENNDSLNEWSPGFIGPYFDITARRFDLVRLSQAHAALCAQDVASGAFASAAWHAARYTLVEAELSRLAARVDARAWWAQ